MNGPLAVLANGLPGAGKTSLARTLSCHLGLPLISKDVIKVVIKEAHADVLGTERANSPLRRWNAALDTARPVDAEAVVAWIQAAKHGHPGDAPNASAHRV